MQLIKGKVVRGITRMMRWDSRIERRRRHLFDDIELGRAEEEVWKRADGMAMMRARNEAASSTGLS